MIIKLVKTAQKHGDTMRPSYTYQIWDTISGKLLRSFKSRSRAAQYAQAMAIRAL